MKSISDFEVGVTLGTGSFGRVRIANHKETNNHYAVKMLKKAEVVRFQQVEHMKSEKTILEEIALDPHPFIVTLASTFQDERYLYVVLEYVCGGEFFTYLRNAGHFESAIARFYAAHIVLIFESLHSKDIIYRDLKPENLLLDSEGYLKLTDFGFAKKVKYKTFTLCGTPEYIAPEVILNKGHGKGVDWWTLGILIYEMISGEPPFVADDPMGIYQQILSGKVSFPRGYDKSAKSITKKLLLSDLTKRYGCLKGEANDIKRCKWLNDISWEKLLKRSLDPPIKPEISGEADTSCFDSYADSDDEAPLPIFENGDPFFEM
mmetsp:Transcript_4720/g.5667  ORF Transcript_4720/g.5667 Transcript_4720/m.5667 type:complete len:319 (+) Transcript_4720:116-1072(+)|eukprot:CAMPEP_0194378482 /NCGR_PEP_ID=MMETSP0174-20130528/35501_1 /TAXON_ID=216777 /ORGANISM="Proboscia alata, Strain PI-D3" /LENGTH=318 /DNA_ID=CAMNT_0039160523 /DNA_START=111 /DNA_END=1067 /DNA_ORIENTATION=+